MDWITTVDHKKIGILYLIAGGLFFLIGGIEAILIRIQLMGPKMEFVSAAVFNELITMHGTTMIFLAAMPLIFALMNAIVPLQIGARDVAFPFLNSLGFWTFFFGGLLLNLSWIVGGAPDAGWTSYVPLATNEYSTTHGVDFYTIGLQIAGIGTLLGGINFLATIITMRAPGMTFMRMPMFTWTAFITSALILFAFPAVTVGLVLLTFDRLFGANFFEVANGGNPILWQHIFWIFGHPEVYILILPAFGIISEVISTFSRKRLFGYSSMVFATMLIGFLGFMVWAHHMFAVGLGPIANALFAVATMLIAIPTGIKIFNWIFTMWGGQITFNTASLFAIGFIPTFVMGGVTGVMLAAAPADYQYHDTYFVVAHFHYVIVGGLILGLFSGFHYWWPKMFGRMLNETLGKLTFVTFYIGFHLTFFVQHFLGLIGMPRRVFTYLPNQGFDTMNLISSIGAFLMGVGTIFFLLNIVVSAKKRGEVPADPWQDGRTIEWTIPSPPPEYNFKQTPLVRGYDAYWKEKMAGNKEMTPAEPVGPIHMPSASILPFLMSVGLFIAGFGFMFAKDTFGNAFVGMLFNNYIVAIIGLVITFASMAARSIVDDHGWHIEPDELNDKGVKA
ncbi:MULTISPECIES: cytochrome c oxidase subunit I [unclassified Paenibacillus]|uniref:cytochrome c oxidase subunit I n=1 Tax=unclassified Paenibacillus TaxID=185978 RepID=UPI001C10C5ED|nr:MULTISPECIES: cytochrome c oxidase subunit I [unclassified Paenibacillus]MBU5441043.1 cytochrome c oxidase subunit I [Paenibacillus sp. MSJ-34]